MDANGEGTTNLEIFVGQALRWPERKGATGAVAQTSYLATKVPEAASKEITMEPALL